MEFIVYDLEMTCGLPKREKQEIIEIGAIKVNENLEIIDEFQELVQPVRNRVLTPFARNLLKIEQRDIDIARFFPEVAKDFIKWMGKDHYMIAWGCDDLKTWKSNCGKYQMSTRFLNYHYNIQPVFSKSHTTNNDMIGLTKALEILQITPKGNWHRALDDAINTTEIFISMMNKEMLDIKKKHSA